MTRIENFDLDDKRLRPYAGMTDGQLRRGEGFRRDCPQGLFVGESARVIERALDAGIRPFSVLADEHWARHDAAIIKRIEQMWPETPVFICTVEQFRQLTGYQVVRGALAVFERPELPSIEEVLSGARRVAVFENICNFENMGTLFRSAAALGIDGVLVTPSCHDPYYRRCARVSMGAVFQVPWTRIGVSGEPWIVSGMPLLHDHGFQVAALALRDQALDLRDERLAAVSKLALVLGTEGEGLAPETIDASDFVVRIPMAHGVDSLNVSVAGAIAFWQLVPPNGSNAS